MKIFLFLFPFSLLAACAPLSDNERAGIQRIQDIYETSCDHSTEEKCFVIRLTGSRLINNSDNLEIPASHCAFTFYTALPLGGERERYSSIRVELERSGLFRSGKISREYMAEELQLMEKNAQWFDVIVNCIKHRDFDYILNNTHASTFAMIDSAAYLKKMLTLGKLTGEVKSGTFMGFSSHTMNDEGRKKELMILNGKMETANGKWDLFVMIDPVADGEEKQLYGFKWSR
jgi:hypothetical protein